MEYWVYDIYYKLDCIFLAKFLILYNTLFRNVAAVYFWMTNS